MSNLRGLGNLGNIEDVVGIKLLPGGIKWPPSGIQWPPKLPDSVEILKKEIENGAKSVVSDQVATSLQSFIEEANKLGQEVISEQGRQYIEAIEKIKEEYNKLKEQLDINKIKRDILTKAEEFCEAYLKEKVSLPEDFPIKIYPKVHLDFNMKRISIEIALYVMKQEDDEKTYRKTYLVAATFLIRQNLNESIQTPDFDVEPNPDLVQNEVDKIIKEIKDQEEIIVKKLIASVMSDYLPPLMLLKNYLPIF
ncbi:hypothetical protein P4520_17485 [Bacillus thuringiensis]|nr:hypothetical protein [Bacillus thuringiensis]MED3632992.1 hypothetical protein [Bacillus thuringiensis]